MTPDTVEPTISFVVATRNRRDSLTRCLRSIEAQRYGRREVVVVDDGSTDGTEQAVREGFPSARYVRLEEHGGIGSALDRGSREASGGIWVNIDDDAWFASPDSAEVIARHFAERSDLAVLCFRVEAPDGTVRRREIPRLDKRMPETETALGYFLGGAVAYRASALEAVGGYPTDIGYASEDLDTSFRLFRAGYRMLFTPSVRVVHEAIPSPANTEQREANYARSRVRIAARYLPAPYAQVHAFLWIGRSLAFAALNGHLSATVSTVVGALRAWPSDRGRKSERLTLRETRRLSRLSGRTWY